VPSTQLFEQHSAPLAQAPVFLQDTHRPLLHFDPGQQFEVVSHAEPSGLHVSTGPQTPLLQLVEQHSVPAPHAAPLLLQLPASGS